MSEYDLPMKIIGLWCWPVDLVAKLKNRWCRLILIGPAFLLLIGLMLILGIPFLLSVIAEPFIMSFRGEL